MVVEKATAAGLFTDQKDRDRAARLLNSLKPRAEADRKDAAKFDAEDAKNQAGDFDGRSMPRAPPKPTSLYSAEEIAFAEFDAVLSQ